MLGIETQVFRLVQAPSHRHLLSPGKSMELGLDASEPNTPIRGLRSDDRSRQQCRDLGRARGNEAFYPPEMQPVARMLIAKWVQWRNVCSWYVSPCPCPSSLSSQFTRWQLLCVCVLGVVSVYLSPASGLKVKNSKLLKIIRFLSWSCTFWYVRQTEQYTVMSFTLRNGAEWRPRR